MKRHPALLTLTHDHHHGLAQARRLKRSADAEDTERMETASVFMDFFRSETLVHFREEEESVFPLLLDHAPDTADALSNVLVEHVRMHGLVSRLDDELAGRSVSAETLRALGDLLEGHIRNEERVLFEIIQDRVPESQLQRLTYAERNRRTNG